VALGGTPTAFALDGLSFFVSAACLAPLALRTAPRPDRATASSPLVDLREGLQTVFGSGWLWITIAIFSLVNVTASGPMAVALPFLIKESLNAGVGALGIVTSSFSVGEVLTAVWMGRYERFRRRGWIAYIGTFIFGLMILAIGLPMQLPGICAVAFIGGAAISSLGLIWTNLLQELVPREKLGRVSSIDALGSFALLSIGFGLAGWLTDRLARTRSSCWAELSRPCWPWPALRSPRSAIWTDLRS